MSESKQTTRRALLGGAGILIVPPAAVRGSQANSKISVGLIGTGNRGTYDASIVHADPRARITALCDLFDDQIERGMAKIKVEKPAVYKDFQKLLGSSSIDAVFIATPVFEHPRMLEAAVEARKHIYCEKPAGADYTGCKRVIAAGKRQDPKKDLAFGFQQRYGPVYVEPYKALRNGDIGALTYAGGYWLGGGIPDPAARPRQQRPTDPDPKLARIRNWYAYPDLCGDFIVEQDCHNFDDLHWFLGALPIRVAGYGGRKLRTDRETYDHLSLTYEFPNGLHVTYQASQVTPPGIGRVGEEYAGSQGAITTSRKQSIVWRGRNKQTIDATRDITMDGIEAFLGRIETGKVENVGERSCISTLFGILLRTAMYRQGEAVWKKEFGDV